MGFDEGGCCCGDNAGLGAATDDTETIVAGVASEAGVTAPVVDGDEQGGATVGESGDSIFRLTGRHEGMVNLSAADGPAAMTEMGFFLGDGAGGVSGDLAQAGMINMGGAGRWGCF